METLTWIKQHVSIRESETDLEITALPMPNTHYTAVGCERCSTIGYRGRTGIYELVEVDTTLRNMIHNNAGQHALEEFAYTRHLTMQQDGLRRVLAGETTLEELLRITQEE
jgi:general secretion pathway protein E